MARFAALIAFNVVALALGRVIVGAAFAVLAGVQLMVSQAASLVGANLGVKWSWTPGSVPQMVLCLIAVVPLALLEWKLYQLVFRRDDE